jgi:hypothetical protein
VIRRWAALLKIVTSKKRVFPVPIVKTSDDFRSLKPKEPRKKAKMASHAALPKNLPRPPVPEYAHDEIFSGQLLEKYKD